MMLSKTGTFIVCLACFTLTAACKGKISKQHAPDTTIIRMDTLYYVNIHKKSIEQAVNPAMLLQHTYKFVEVEVVKVFNPKKYPVIFDVYYRCINNKKILLGTFSLYPSDNPGKFIVATQGKVNKEGSIIISLTTPAKMNANDTLEVAIKKITLREK